MTVIHEFTAFHIPLRHHEAVYPGTLNGGKIWGSRQRRWLMGRTHMGGKAIASAFSFYCLKARRCAVWEGQQTGGGSQHGRAEPWEFARLAAVMKVLSD